MLPVKPYLVRNSIGLNHAISSALKNICTIVALFLCTREGYPVNMIRFKITRSGSTPRPFIMSDPLPTNSFVFSSNIKRGEGAYVTGPNAVVPEFECVGKIGVRVRIYQKLLHTTEITLRHESLKLGLFTRTVRGFRAACHGVQGFCLKSTKTTLKHQGTFRLERLIISLCLLCSKVKYLCSSAKRELSIS